MVACVSCYNCKANNNPNVTKTKASTVQRKDTMQIHEYLVVEEDLIALDVLAMTSPSHFYLADSSAYGKPLPSYIWRSPSKLGLSFLSVLELFLKSPDGPVLGSVRPVFADRAFSFSCCPPYELDSCSAILFETCSISGAI